MVWNHHNTPSIRTKTQNIIHPHSQISFQRPSQRRRPASSQIKPIPLIFSPLQSKSRNFVPHLPKPTIQKSNPTTTFTPLLYHLHLSVISSVAQSRSSPMALDRTNRSLILLPFPGPPTMQSFFLPFGTTSPPQKQKWPILATLCVSLICMIAFKKWLWF